MKLEELLIKKYGPPKMDGQDWSNDLFKNDRRKWGMALSHGHVTFVTSWETETSKIGMLLNGTLRGVNFQVDYQSIKFKPKTGQRVEQNPLDDL